MTRGADVWRAHSPAPCKRQMLGYDCPTRQGRKQKAEPLSLFAPAKSDNLAAAARCGIFTTSRVGLKLAMPPVCGRFFSTEGARLISLGAQPQDRRRGPLVVKAPTGRDGASLSRPFRAHGIDRAPHRGDGWRVLLGRKVTRSDTGRAYGEFPWHPRYIGPKRTVLSLRDGWDRWPPFGRIAREDPQE